MLGDSCVESFRWSGFGTAAPYSIHRFDGRCVRTWTNPYGSVQPCGYAHLVIPRVRFYDNLPLSAPGSPDELRGAAEGLDASRGGVPHPIAVAQFKHDGLDEASLAVREPMLLRLVERALKPQVIESGDTWDGRFFKHSYGCRDDCVPPKLMICDRSDDGMMRIGRLWLLEWTADAEVSTS